MNILDFFKPKPTKYESEQNSVKPDKSEKPKGILPPGRVSVPNDNISSYLTLGDDKLVSPSFRIELIELLRKLYKVNPDVGIALQDLFKLTNTGHRIVFPNNTSEEGMVMREYLKKESVNWTNYTAGIDGLINKFITQLLISGAISIECVPNEDLDAISSIVLVNTEDIVFKRVANGSYHPYQINKYTSPNRVNEPYIKLNLLTYKYVSLFNDTDEPYGIPPFMMALPALKEQQDMKENNKNIMSMMGLMGFLEAKMEKPIKNPRESDEAYIARLETTLRNLKLNLSNGLKDGLVVGYKDDHEFKLNSTTKDLSNLDKIWNLNQQSVANGLGVNGTIIGVSTSTTEGGAGILLSKQIALLKNLQMVIGDVLKFIYGLSLKLGGYSHKGIEIEFIASTVTDDIKFQQAQEYKIRNLIALYNQGIIDQNTMAFIMGYTKPAEEGPINTPEEDDIDDSTKKANREKDKDKSDRKTRDKNKPMPKRKDGDSKER